MNRNRLLTTIVVAALAIAAGAYFVGRTTVGTPSGSPHPAPSTTSTSTITPPPTTTTVQPSATSSPEPTVPATVIAACSRIGGTPAEGQDNWYILGPTYISPQCKNVPYIGPDGETYYDTFPLTQSGVASTDIYGNSTASFLKGNAATQTECITGQYPEANPGVDFPGVWDSSLGLCLP